RPICTRQGYFRLKAKFNTRGNQTEVTYWDSDGKATCSVEGFAKIARDFDEQGQLVEESFLDTVGNLALNRIQGFAKRRMTYDDWGNSTLETRLDADGKLRQRTTAFFDADGQPTPHADGYARRIEQFDVHGNCKDKIYRDLEGYLVRRDT